jgi:adenosylhomocysteine nucleosidase
MKIGIIGAMEPEVALLKDAIVGLQTVVHHGFNFFTGQINDVEVILVQSGIGKVASTIATTLLLTHFNPDCVINTGSAGGFDPELNVGDVVISSEVRHHDVDVTAFNYEIGQVPNMPPAFIANKTLIDAAEQSIKSIGDVKVKTGLITTGDTFMCDPVVIDQARKNFPTMKAVEMEGAAIAQTCHQMSVPFVVIRSLSDIAGKESPESFEAYLEKASKYSSQMVMALLTNLQGKDLVA